MKRSKKPTKKVGLFVKYYIAIAATSVVSLLVLSLVFSAFLYNYWKERTTETLKSNASELSGNMHAVLDEKGLSAESVKYNTFIKDIMEVYRGTKDCDYFLTDTDGKIIASSAGFNKISDVKIPEEILALNAFTSPVDEKSVEVRWEDYGGKSLVSLRPFYSDTEHIITIITVKPLSDFQPFIDDILYMLTFSSLAALLITVLAAYYLVYKVYKPISKLKEATEKIGAGDYSYRINTEKYADEFAYLGNAFNDMASKLGALETSRRSFVANISHELKTPMTTIGGYIDALIDGTISHDKQDHYLQIISSEVKRLSRLVVAMLNLSKIEAGELKLQKKKVNIASLLFNIMLSFEQVIENNKIEIIGFEELESVEAMVDRDMIYQVFYNLIDNAVKFTDKGGAIRVRLKADSEKAVFAIMNTCSGITKEDLEKIFERFYKVDRSRNLDVKGFGLGLYLAKTIVQMHGGQITARSVEGQNCEFIFWIPLE